MDASKLIHIHTAPDEITAHSVKNLLEINGIKSFIKANPNIRGAFRGVFGTPTAPYCPWFIYVDEKKHTKSQRTHR